MHVLRPFFIQKIFITVVRIIMCFIRASGVQLRDDLTSGPGGTGRGVGHLRYTAPVWLRWLPLGREV